MLVLVGALAPGCGAGTPVDPDYEIGASAVWSWTAAEPEALGYTVALLLEQRAVEGACRDAPDSTRLTVDGVDVPLVRDPDTGCLTGQFLSRPVRGDLAVTARVEEWGELVGEVVFEGLMPGTAATLVRPSDGQVRPGDDVLVIPPQQLPTSFGGWATYYPLEDGAWLPEGILVESSVRDLEGLHVTVPTFTGPAVLIFHGTPVAIVPDVVCPGFAYCTEDVEVTLGPFMLTGVP
jgi:hypothetical protein